MGVGGYVSTSHASATAAGLAVLRAGGGAVDAAIAVAATLAVVEPAMSGPGGCGYFLIHDAADSRQYVLDFMGRLPRRGLGAPWSPGSLLTGAAGALVPGAVAGWFAAHARFGSLPIAELLAAPIAIAERGSALSANNADWAARSWDRLRDDPALAGRFFPGGRAPVPGTMISDPDLARTYRRLAADGPDAFYRGAVAEEMVEASRAQGGSLELDDLASYQASWEEPLAGGYRGWRVLTTPPPTSGGQLVTTLGLLEGFDLGGGPAGRFEHLVIECAKAAIADRRSRLVRSGDPALLALAGPEEVAILRAGISLDRAAPSEGDRVAIGPSTRGFTTAYVVADPRGNVVASTQSLGQLFGGARTLGRTGVVINDFAWWTDPAGPNAYRAGARIESPLTPLVALGPAGQVVAVASPGSNAIMQIIPQVLVRHVDLGLRPEDAVAAPRLVSLGRRPHVDPWGEERAPTLVGAESRFGAEVLAALRERGHVIEPLGAWSHQVGACAMVIRSADGSLEGAADPRRESSAALAG